MALFLLLLAMNADIGGETVVGGGVVQLMNDDIAHIESQNRGLQVQTSNQRALLDEIDKLMVCSSLVTLSYAARAHSRTDSGRSLSLQSTIHIPDGDMTALTEESLESQQGIERLERAAVSLYKALLSTRDTGQSLPLSYVLVCDPS